MCGITGFQRRPGCAPGLDLSAAVRAIRHRGPDAQGVRVEGDSGLGHTRLSIIDLSQAGAQPMASPDERYLIAFNGEIYNFAELRTDLEKKGERFNGHSDTEVLLRLFMVAGFEACLERLRGMFALAILDRAEDTLYVARDRLGVKPLVYAETGDAFLFGSEIASLFALDPGLSRAVDHQALDLYLSFQYIPSPHSGFKAVRKLEPAHALVVRGGRIQRHFRYWDVDLERRTTLSYAEAQEALREQVLEATRLRLVSDVPLGAFLSGGVDSSITVAAMARLTDQPVKTYSIGFDDPAFDETRYARQAAEFLATDHHEMQVTPSAAELLPRIVAHHGEPFADNSALPSYYVSEFARRSVTVALTGDGPDEVFGGYRRFTHALRMDRLDGLGLLPLWRTLRRGTVALEDRLRGKPPRAFPASRADQALWMRGLERYQHLYAFVPEADKAGLYRPGFRERVRAGASTEWLRGHFERAGGDDILNRYLYLEMKSFMVEDVLYKVDIASMMPALECRSPFLDHRLIEFAFTLPGAWKIQGRDTKRILKDAFRDWLPDGFMERPKMGFSAPVGGWMKNDLAPLLRERLLDDDVLHGLIDRDRLHRNVEAHLAGRPSSARELWALLVLAQWLRQSRVSL